MISHQLVNFNVKTQNQHGILLKLQIIYSTENHTSKFYQGHPFYSSYFTFPRKACCRGAGKRGKGVALLISPWVKLSNSTGLIKQSLCHASNGAWLLMRVNWLPPSSPPPTSKQFTTLLTYISLLELNMQTGSFILTYFIRLAPLAIVAAVWGGDSQCPVVFMQSEQIGVSPLGIHWRHKLTMLCDEIAKRRAFASLCLRHLYCITGQTVRDWENASEPMQKMTSNWASGAFACFPKITCCSMMDCCYRHHSALPLFDIWDLCGRHVLLNSFPYEIWNLLLFMHRPVSLVVFHFTHSRVILTVLNGINKNWAQMEIGKG